MCPHALIPYKLVNPKTRLSCVLSQEEREAFARAMLEDVIHAVKDANCSPVIVGTELLTARISRSRSSMQISIRHSIHFCPMPLGRY
jgi:2-phospho-L-lactate guanylyltransferase